jgi:excinuclease ABC subunit C
MVESLLDQIAGLGESRRKSLIEVFGSISALKAADVEEIAAVPGIGLKLASVIYEKLSTLEKQRKIDPQSGEIFDA